MPPISRPAVLTVAGSDSGGGAGVQADLKTFDAHGVFGSSVITALTAQNTVGVQAVHVPPVDFLVRQLRSVLDDISYGAVKTGMLPNANVIDAVTELLPPEIPIVVDPVMVATSGDSLTAVSDEWFKSLRGLLRRAALVTPNLAEAEQLWSQRIGDEHALRAAARDISENNGRIAVLLKGGHTVTPGATAATDVLWDGERFHAFALERLDSRNTHGTGCTLSSAIASELALGRNLVDAVKSAKSFVHAAIREGHAPGHGHGVLNFNKAAAGRRIVQ